MPPKTKIKLTREARSGSREKSGKTWILVAQRTKAKLFEYGNRGKSLKLVEGFVNPGGNLKTNQLVSDRPGRVYGLLGNPSRSASVNREDPHQLLLKVFARALADRVESGLMKGLCDRIILAAEPHCLGEIKKALSARAKSKLRASIHKDLFLLDEQKLYIQLEGELR